ncbi:MAG: hypothetical protein DI556_03285 [Rhodovulum sulfidophilum]|uniref:Right handed beta helix domain-containing protein n=1 Tax=Rhodovulum sulfidophilum TaxID=35806 RepID=A0A2W5NG58_RHOSU|nr:MAG: hypothetical protein DI556_03285 [Rhodovulum sulfidophilum]
MAVLSASNKTELLAALKSAKGGDTIQLAYGKYGSISLDGTKASSNYLKYAGEVKIVSADSSKKAIIDELSLKGVTNLTFEKINFDYATKTNSNGLAFNINTSKDITFRGNVFGGEFDDKGYGLGTGLKVSQGSNILIENSVFTGFRKGIEAWAVDGLTLQNNTLQSISYDGVVSGHVQGLTIKNNTIAMTPNPAEDQHRDGIQIYNQGAAAVSRNILIEKNTITATDTTTHGIFMGNADARGATDYGEFYANVVIRDNTVMTGQKLGIAVGQTNGLTVSGNTIIQHDFLNDDPRVVTIPLLHVEEDSINVSISGNILNGAPVVSDANWQSVLGANPGWAMNANAIVKLAWKIGQSTIDPWAGVRGNGEADEFRFKGTWVANTDRTDVNDKVNFEEGDTIVLINYQANTFKGVWQGNKLDVSAAGDYAKIDSLVDLQELAATSPKVTATVSGDDLTLHIAQSGGTHHVVLEGLGNLYQSTYDPTLF